ncbi:hypothetical protein J2X04_001708 [Lysobacter niabensis]|uniref:Uncharacterized protein n=1 Tax=Agrilutibacter niabensis TaxID=380628 RepID=A0ABU1VPF9_9GAMM|nr:hypothetical protein [Lysobacter niabensis]MDR7099361.1 hypothetical protein [Lysobacter niabensis]
MSNLKQLKGKFRFVDTEDVRAAEAGAIFNSLLAALRAAYPNISRGDAATVEEATPFAVVLSFQERKGENFLRKVEKALEELMKQLAALLPAVLPGHAGAAMTVVSAVQQLASRGDLTAFDEVRPMLGDKISDSHWKDISPRLDRAQQRQPVAATAKATQNDWRTILDILLGKQTKTAAGTTQAPSDETNASQSPPSSPPPSSAPAVPVSFETTQLMGWLSKTTSEAEFDFQVSGFTKHPDNDVIFGENARLDVLGPDGSQLLTVHIDGGLLADWMAWEPDQEFALPASRAHDLRVALSNASKTRKHLATVSGRLWFSDGRPFGVRNVAVYAGPAVSRLIADCCLPIGLQSDDSCLSVIQEAGVFLSAPQALSVTATDNGGYFEFSYLPEDGDADLRTEYALFQISGVAAPVVLKLRGSAGESDQRTPYSFPDPVLLQIDTTLLLRDTGGAPNSMLTGVDQHCACDEKTIKAEGSVLEEFKFEVIVRTTDPSVLRKSSTSPPPTDLDSSAVAVNHLFRGHISREERIPWELDDGPAEAVTISHGRILTVRQSWVSDGYSLGDLRYSLPLAPLQKKNIAVIDWDRTDTLSAESNIDYREELDNYLGRERDINEIVTSALKERISAESRSGSSSKSKGFGFSALGSVFGGSSGGSSGAWTTSNQNSSRDLTASLMNQLRDRMVQSANAVRSQRTSIVQQVTQSESSKVVTETVANRNSCHAITVQYYEVLRHLKVDHELSSVRECLFIPLTITPFKADKALRWRDILATALPPSLADGLDACERLEISDASEPATIADEPIVGLSGVLDLTISFTLPAAALEGAPTWNAVVGVGFTPAVPEPLPTLCTRLAMLKSEDRLAFFNSDIAPVMAQKFLDSLTLRDANMGDLGLKATLSTSYRPGGLHRVHLADAGNIAANAYTRNKLGEQLKLASTLRLAPDGSIVLQSGHLRVATEHSDLRANLFCGNGIELGKEDVATANMPLVSAERRSRKTIDQRSRDALLKHLNHNVEYYHKVIWWQMDPDRRFALLDGFIAPNSGGRSVASVVENHLTAIIGNNLVMPVATGVRLDLFDDYRDEKGNPVADTKGSDLIDLYRPTTPLPSTRISIPTKGVFAESVMGSCNSCERIDDRRNWQHWLHPLPDDPTAIEPIAVTGHAKDTPPAVPTQLPAAAIINQMAANPAPDLLGLAAAIAATTNGTAFRDAMGTAGTQANSRDALARSFGVTQRFGELGAEITKKQIDAGVEAAKMVFSAYTGIPLPPSSSGGDTSSVRKNIVDDINEGRINPEEGKNLLSRLNSDQVDGLNQERPITLHDNPVVRDAIRTGAENGSAVSLSDGNQRVDIGATNDSNRVRGSGLLARLLSGKRRSTASRVGSLRGQGGQYDRPLTVEVVTTIRNVKGAIETGEKSRHVMTLNPASGLVTERVLLGTTDLLIYKMEAIRSKFTATSSYENDDRYRIRARGSTASGVGVFPSIDYDLAFGIDLVGRTIEITGTHDGFPSYSVLVNGKTVYDFVQGHMLKSWPLLYGTSDVTVQKEAKF